MALSLTRQDIILGSLKKELWDKFSMTLLTTSEESH